MTKSTITRERLQEIAEDGFLKHGESKELARMALAAMDSEPVYQVYGNNDDTWSDVDEEEMIRCRSIGEDTRTLYSAPQSPVVDSEPVARTSEEAIAEVYCDETGMIGPKYMVGDVPLYRPAQPAQTGVDDDVRNIIGLLETNEWAEHCTETVLGSRLEAEITRLVGSAQTAPVVLENCVTAEHRRVIELLLNVCGAAFELADDSCQQDVDGEDCHVVPDDAFQKLSDALDEIENTLPTEDIDRPDVFLAWSAMPRAALKSILQAGTLR